MAKWNRNVNISSLPRRAIDVTAQVKVEESEPLYHLTQTAEVQLYIYWKSNSLKVLLQVLQLFVISLQFPGYVW